MAAGDADDLATTLLLATDQPVVVAPAMNVRMWLHPATARNIQQLTDDGVRLIEPAEGEMACGEHGPGRLPEPTDIMEWLGANKFLPRSTAAGEGDHAQHGGGG
jgi:phosphopantothenoylcysteine decarboxylase/phosphopantothenate--cysteine ligase